MEVKLKELEDLLVLVREIVEKEPQILEIEGRTVIVGDTHADFQTTKKILERWTEENILFLGDYVDRATSEFGSIKNLYLLARAKMDSPDRIFLLRGNHEFIDINSIYGFLGECKQFEGEFSSQSFLYYLANEFFAQLPYIAFLGEDLLALHGGLPNISSLEELELPKGVKKYTENKFISQIVWSDHSVMVIGSAPNLKRGFRNDFALLYGRDYFEEKMGVFGREVLVRGHDYNAIGSAFGGRLLTIFSCARYGQPLVAVWNGERVKSVRDLEILEIK